MGGREGERERERSKESVIGGYGGRERGREGKKKEGEKDRDHILCLPPAWKCLPLSQDPVQYLASPLLPRPSLSTSLRPS